MNNVPNICMQRTRRLRFVFMLKLYGRRVADASRWCHYHTFMKQFTAILRLAIVGLLVSCSKAPTPFAGTWETGGGMRKQEIARGLTAEFPSARFILVLKRDGSGLVQRAEPLFHPETFGRLRWKYERDKLVLIEGNGDKRALTILEKTETTLKVLQPASTFDTTPGNLVVYTRTGDAN